MKQLIDNLFSFVPVFGTVWVGLTRSLFGKFMSKFSLVEHTDEKTLSFFISYHLITIFIIGILCAWSECMYPLFNSIKLYFAFYITGILFVPLLFPCILHDIINKVFKSTKTPLMECFTIFHSKTHNINYYLAYLNSWFVLLYRGEIERTYRETLKTHRNVTVDNQDNGVDAERLV